MRVSPTVLDCARSMRRDATEAERLLWRRLRNGQIEGVKFRRQFPIGAYITDFACLAPRLIVECDGGQHADSDYDAIRDAWLLGQGFSVLRFWNHEVIQNLDGVVEAISNALAGLRQ